MCGCKHMLLIRKSRQKKRKYSLYMSHYACEGERKRSTTNLLSQTYDGFHIRYTCSPQFWFGSRMIRNGNIKVGSFPYGSH